MLWLDCGCEFKDFFRTGRLPQRLRHMWLCEDHTVALRQFYYDSDVRFYKSMDSIFDFRFLGAAQCGCMALATPGYEIKFICRCPKHRGRIEPPILTDQCDGEYALVDFYG